jgi:hypothetical protein
MSNEAFSMRNGQKVDSHIHEPILSGIAPEAEQAMLMESYHSAIKDFGIDPKTAAKMYGLEFPSEPFSATPDKLS